VPGEDGDKIDALIRLEVACRLALAALPELSDEIEQQLRTHVEAVCEVTGAALDEINPDWRATTAARCFGDRS
jgi:hypothetical protein